MFESVDGVVMIDASPEANFGGSMKTR